MHKYSIFLLWQFTISSSISKYDEFAVLELNQPKAFPNVMALVTCQRDEDKGPRMRLRDPRGSTYYKLLQY